MLIDFYRFIEGREIRCAVLESVKTGKLQALSCIEYNVCKDDIRKTEVKLQLNEKGLPIGKYSSFFSNFNPYNVRDFIDELQWRLKIRIVVLFISSFYSQSWLDAFFLLSAQWASSNSCETKQLHLALENRYYRTVSL